MRTWTIGFTRSVITYDRVERDIEAETPEEAERIAEDMARAFNRDCPDDTTEGDSPTFADWVVDECNSSEATEEECYAVLGIGQA